MVVKDILKLLSFWIRFWQFYGAIN